ncbi:MAG: sulfatase [Planctomycetota bacterium]|jgi:arylsulfatase
MCGKQHITIVLVAAGTCLAGYGSNNTNMSGRTRPIPEPSMNVILITVSTLRADHVSCLGYARDTTAHFDAFAQESTLFSNAFATSSWMMPAHGSIFTSLRPALHGATHIKNALAPEPETLAEILRAKGYRTVGFCCNPRLDQEHGFAQGFDLYYDYGISTILHDAPFQDQDTGDINKQRTNHLVNDAAIRWLQNNTQEPFYMFLHYYDNHWDYLPPEPYRTLYDPDYEGPIDGTQIAREPLYSNVPGKRDIQHIVALYDGEVKQTDNDLGEMLEFLKTKGLCDRSIVVVLGDHGEQFYEHGNTSHHGLFEELIHVPMAMSIPDEGEKGKVIDSLVSQRDILPTILDYLKIPTPAQCQGKSLRPLIGGHSETVHDFVCVEYTGGAVPNAYAVRGTQYKCYHTDNEFFAYDLIKDPAEQHKILPDRFTDQTKILQKALRKLIDKDLKIESK